MVDKMKMPIGTRLVCISTDGSLKATEVGKEYIFDGYNEEQIPKNKQNAVMTWYPDRPIWTPEEYEDIRAKFMQINLVGVDRPQQLKNFKIIS